MVLIGILIWLWFVIEGGEATCSSSIKQGPYTLEKPMLNMTVPTRHKLVFQRVWIDKDVELTIMYRSFWSSYCYMGGNIDPNTGCYRGITQDLPSYQEADEWIQNQKCKIGNDCTDCWGSDSDACIDPTNNKNIWTTGKELEKKENNNHFFCHTCNLSWRCGMHTARFPTFITRRDNKWLAYTSYANGTEFDMNEQNFWSFEDVIIKKTAAHQTLYQDVELSCFENGESEVACYDQEKGIFFELQEDWYCFERICYLLDPKFNTYNLTKRNFDDVSRLQAASIADLGLALAHEKMLSEEMRYNFGKLVEEVVEIRKILTTVILSVAKIDDRLIGSVMGHPARSQFLSEEEFLLSPCSEPEPQNSNCVKDLIFKNGRWIKQSDPTECLSLQNGKIISLFKTEELWFPKILDQDILGTAENFEGWSYYAHERDNLDKAMQWTTNGQSITSLSDLYDLPKGLLNGALSGFLLSHSITFIAIGIISIIIYRKLFSNNMGINLNLAGLPNIGQHQFMGMEEHGFRTSNRSLPLHNTNRGGISRQPSIKSMIEALQGPDRYNRETEWVNLIDERDGGEMELEEETSFMTQRPIRIVRRPRSTRRAQRNRGRRPISALGKSMTNLAFTR